MNADIQRIVRKLDELPGWSVRQTPGQHYQARGPKKALFHFPATPSDSRSIKNIRAKLRRLGAEV